MHITELTLEDSPFRASFKKVGPQQGQLVLKIDKSVIFDAEELSDSRRNEVN